MRTDRPNRPELLSPAGDWEAMRAAVANGADAVYFGLSNFNARHRATNFTLDELPEVMSYLHSHNVRGYVTFNTLIFSDELPEAVDFIKAIAAANVDAVIVQDLGLANLIHHLAPSLHVHGSTQMTLTEPRGVEWVKRLGVSRVILARELSADDIQKITAVATLPVEIFIHGALCVSYSGQCLTSEALGGRSANRGQCAQACRLPYELFVDGQKKDLGEKAYLLSPQDLAAHDLIHDLVQLGVCSFKIEGRLKSAHYVAATTQTYRAALDHALQHSSSPSSLSRSVASSPQKFQISPQQKLDLAQSFSRGFTHGFLSGVNHQSLVPARFPKSRGVRIGTVSSITPHSVLVQLETESTLKPGDGIVFDEGHPDQDEQGGRIYQVRAPSPSRDATRRASLPQVELTFGQGHLNLAAIAPRAIVWKTDDPAVRKRLEQSFSRQDVVHREPLSIHVTARTGQNLQITATDTTGRTATVRWTEKPLELAQNRPITEQTLREQFSRLGDTPYELASITLDADPVMIPKSILNDLRRQAIEQLLKQRQNHYPIANPDVLSHLRNKIQSLPPSCDFFASPLRGLRDLPSSPNPSLYVLTRTLDQLQAVLSWASSADHPPAMIYCDFEDVRRYKEAVDLARAAHMPIAVATMRVVKAGEDGFLRIVLDANPDAVLIRNLAALAFFTAESPSMPLIGDYALNIANELTADLFRRENVRRMVPSYDLNWTQMSAMLSRIDPGLFEVVVHQHIPMFHMEHCVFAATLSTGKDFRDCGRPCEKHSVDLKDREGQPHPLIPDAGCRNTVFNAAAQSAAEYIPQMLRAGLRHFRIELLRQTPEETTSLLNKYTRVLAGLEDGRQTWQRLRVLNQLGVTRGTLENE